MVYISWLYIPCLTLATFFPQIYMIQGERKGGTLLFWFWNLQSWKGVCFFSKKFSLTLTLTLTVRHTGLKYLRSLLNHREISHLDFLITRGEGCFHSSPRPMQAGSLWFSRYVDVSWELQTTGAAGSPVSSRGRLPRAAVCCVLGTWNRYGIRCSPTCSSVGLSLLHGLSKQTRD